jgi:23S rRNA (adenine2503-C2)-methyltransferase
MPSVSRPRPPNLYGLDRRALAELTENHGFPPFHAGQLYRWLYQRRVFDPDGWTDLPRDLREVLSRDARVEPGAIDGSTAADDGTIKYRIRLAGRGSVETVLMTQNDRLTLCLSSQVGCALDCDFCLTGKMGLKRQMSAGEIAGQVALIQQDRDLGETSFNVVFMGMGEPLHNYPAVMNAVRLLTDPEGFGLSRRRITISTAGMAPAIERLAREPVRPRLAVSLNATTDELRDRLMPINRRYPLARLLDACGKFARAAGEPFTLEYVLLHGVNDGDDDIDRLIRIVRPLRAKVNLIPFNPVPEHLPYVAPTRDRIVGIRDRLLERKVAVGVRWSRGLEARAACGQLALLNPKPGSG